MVLMELRICTKCKKELVLEKNFYKAWPPAEGKYLRRCRRCVKSGQTKNYLYSRQDWLKRYGFSVERYERLLIAQNYGCAICNKKHKEPTKKGERGRLCVDHCHTSGVIRGLLCDSCNRGIGFLGDNPTIVGQAQAYLISGESRNLNN